MLAFSKVWAIIAEVLTFQYFIEIFLLIGPGRGFVPKLLPWNVIINQIGALIKKGKHIKGRLIAAACWRVDVRLAHFL